MNSGAASGSNSQLSGFSIAFGFLVLGVLCLAAPDSYFGYARGSEAALVFYIFAALFMLISVAGFFSELANREIASFLKALITGRLPNSIWGSPSAETWNNLGAGVACLIPSFLIHMVGIELLDPTGVVEAIVRLLALVLLSPAVVMLTGFVDELIIQPFLVTPARRLAASDYHGGGSEPPTTPPDAPPKASGTDFATIGRRLVASFFALGQGLGTVYAVNDLVQSFLAVIS